MRILIVEDDPVLSDGLIRSLRGADYAVDFATDGGAADHVLSANSFDLVILDWVCPGSWLRGAAAAAAPRLAPPVLILPLDRWMTGSRARPGRDSSPSRSISPSWRHACGR
jgi:DNA-binding response OmpR family regulator